jgi:hypothetical protein
MTQVQPRSHLLQLGIVVLTVATAAIHFRLAFDWLFIANGIGYLALLAALYLPTFAAHRGLVRWLLIAYTALTVVLWVLIGRKDIVIAYVDKAIEIALIVLLWLEGQTGSR